MHVNPPLQRETIPIRTNRICYTNSIYYFLIHFISIHFLLFYYKFMNDCIGINEVTTLPDKRKGC